MTNGILDVDQPPVGKNNEEKIGPTRYVTLAFWTSSWYPSISY